MGGRGREGGREGGRSEREREGQKDRKTEGEINYEVIIAFSNIQYSHKAV